MPSPRQLSQQIKAIFKKNLNDASRIVIVGIGNELRGDDAAGVLIARKLEERGLPSLSPAIKIVIGGSTPENVTGEIVRFKPSHIVIIDAADIGLEPGDVRIVNCEDISGAAFSTHSLPLGAFVSYLTEATHAAVVILGVQPKEVGLMSEPTFEIRRTVDLMAREIEEVIAQNCGRRDGV